MGYSHLVASLGACLVALSLFVAPRFVVSFLFLVESTSASFRKLICTGALMSGPICNVRRFLALQPQVQEVLVTWKYQHSGPLEVWTLVINKHVVIFTLVDFDTALRMKLVS